MRITYDAVADAVYVILTEKVEPPDTRKVDDDIFLDFNGDDQLVGIEVLDASKRLELSQLMTVVERIDIEWYKLSQDLERRKEAREPIDTKHAKSWVDEVGLDYVVLKDQDTGETRKVRAKQLLGTHPNEPSLDALRELG